MDKDFIMALNELEKNKGVSKDIILDALEKALVKSYQKNYNNSENVEINIEKDTGKISVYAQKKVVEQVEDPINEISLDDAKSIDDKFELSDIVNIEIAPKDFGRVAAQTARNIVIQKIRDAERDAIYNEYLDKENEIITGQVQRIDKYNVYFNLGKIEGIMPLKEQVPTEEYKINDRLKLYIKEVKNTTKEPQIILSRANQGLVVRLFELEVPEITDGVIEIFSISREAGSRTKLAVFSNEEGIDSIGACIGFKGNRVNSIVEELKGEKIDIIDWSKDIKTFISNSLNPAEVVDVLINEKNKQSLAVVKDDQLSLAIGKEGQNVRLAARLTSWKIDIKSEEEFKNLSQEEINEILGIEKKDSLIDEQSDNLDVELNEVIEEMKDLDHEESKEDSN
ncbi:MAG: transcription termination factor NusA [Tissierellia bacterium]|nr:transcription termination factor NusA [Tissierellia bacterium]